MKPDMTIRRGMHIHFMGIGGIGMSALAKISLHLGCTVSGCDIKINSVAYRLKESGACIHCGHDTSHIDKSIDLLVYSSAVKESEQELRLARASGIKTLSRGEFLAALSSDRHLVAVAGAHGKTTTSAMASELLRLALWDPTVAVGGMIRSTGTNARGGTGSYIVAETDESDGSFLHLCPRVAIVTNLDREHLNHYKTFENLVEAFQQFVKQIKPSGTLIRCADDPLIRQTISYSSQISYGFDQSADVTARCVRLSAQGSCFEALYNGRSLGIFMLKVPGRHNILNALAVISLAITLEIPLITAREALEAFRGTERRFQMFRLPGDIWFVEDYAHHPAEIRATLAADTLSERHRVVVFQPHRFSRTLSLEGEFTKCFDRADGLIITDIYPAFEPPIPGVSGERLAGLIKACGHPCVRYVPKQELAMFVRHIAQPGDTVFFLGAGDIGELCHNVVAQLRSSARAAC